MRASYTKDALSSRNDGPDMLLMPEGLSFSASNTFECGQAFRWTRVRKGDDDYWIGIVRGYLVKVRRDREFQILAVEKCSKSKEFDLTSYFSLDIDLDSILRSLPKESFLDSAIRDYYGLRILRQDPWECLVSFLCSINCNIPSIRTRIENLCRKFGAQIEYRMLDEKYYSFPEPKVLARAEKLELLSCRLGFRWKYVSHVAKKIVSGELELESLSKLSYEQACQELISETSGKTFGVGPKVADCVCLFSLGKLEAFPIDVWMIRCLASNYPSLLEPLRRNVSQLTNNKYQEWSKAMRSHFGRYAGYAQQYLYSKTRNSFIPNKGQV